MLPISRCNTAGFRLVLALALLIATAFALSPAPMPMQETVNDKVAHLLTFLVLAFLAHGSWPDRPYRLAPLLLLGYGVALEIVQYFIPNRFFSLLDILADLAGIVVYILLIPLLTRLLEHWDKRGSEG